MLGNSEARHRTEVKLRDVLELWRLAGVHGGRGEGAAGGAVQDARPHVLPGAQAAPHEQDQVQGAHMDSSSTRDFPLKKATRSSPAIG